MSQGNVEIVHSELFDSDVEWRSYERAGLSFMATLKTVSNAKIELWHCEANVC